MCLCVIFMSWPADAVYVQRWVGCICSVPVNIAVSGISPCLYSVYIYIVALFVRLDRRLLHFILRRTFQCTSHLSAGAPLFSLLCFGRTSSSGERTRCSCHLFFFASRLQYFFAGNSAVSRYVLNVVPASHPPAPAATPCLLFTLCVSCVPKGETLILNEEFDSLNLDLWKHEISMVRAVTGDLVVL